MNFLRWQRGRQGTGYDKMLLAQGGNFDCWLLRYPDGSEIPTHTDPVDGRRHYRLNIVLKKSRSGGEFVCADPIISTSRIKLFRPDASPHSVTRVAGTRYVLSVGVALKAG